MEPSSTLTTLVQGASALLPVAIFVAKGCMAARRIRPASKIQKHVLCLPSKGGKTFLFNRLSTQKKYMVIDLDDFLKTCCTTDMMDRLNSAQIARNHFQAEMYYAECANKVLEYIRKQLKNKPTLKVLFLTSCWAWTQAFKKDAIALACPDKDFFQTILEENAGIREQLRRDREDFLETVPRQAVQTYNSYKQLEEMVRTRLDIVHTL